MEFYSYFENDKKQDILESWVQLTSSQAKKVIQGINSEIPDKLALASKILIDSQ